METIQIDYDPKRVDYTKLLDVFLSSHDPTWTSPIRQYASAIMFHDEEQEKLSRTALVSYGKKRGREPATEIIAYSGFTKAEDYHQKYYLRINSSLMSQYEGRFPDENAFTDSTAVARVNGYIGGNGTTEQLEKEKPELGISEEAADALRGILKQAGK
jgi:peptide methionine sulfoxide reductase MsrA